MNVDSLDSCLGLILFVELIADDIFFVWSDKTRFNIRPRYRKQNNVWIIFPSGNKMLLIASFSWKQFVRINWDL